MRISDWSSDVCSSDLFLLVTAPALAEEAGDRAPVTILISIDGFRADYLDRGITPTLSRLAAEGAHGALRPSFPTKTFPNHYAIVPGKDRKSGGSGKSVSGRVVLGGCRISNKKKKKKKK